MGGAGSKLGISMDPSKREREREEKTSKEDGKTELVKRIVNNGLLTNTKYANYNMLLIADRQPT